MEVELKCELVTVKHFGVEMQFYAYYDDHITNTMGAGRIYEADLLDALYKLVGEGGVFYDFGAFIGTHSVFFDKIFKADKVISIECNPISHMLLMNNLRLNDCKNTETMLMAVGNVDGHGVLAYTGHNEGSMGVFYEDAEETIEIKRSGSLITEKPKVVKIDCENNTFESLIGCMCEIAKYKPVIVIEARVDDELNDIIDLLKPLGYELYNTYCSTPTHIFRIAGTI